MLAHEKLMGFIPAKNLAAAKAFYEGRLGFRVVSEDHFGISLETKGALVRIANVGEHTPAAFTILGWEVADVQKTVTELKQAGVEFMRVPGLQQDELGIWAAPSGARVAWFKDPDGNTLSVSQHP